MLYILKTKRRNVSIKLIWRCVRVTNIAVQKPISITYSQCVFVAVVTKHASTVLYCHLRPVRLGHICPHYLINSKRLGKSSSTYSVCFGFLYTFYLRVIQRDNIIVAFRNFSKASVIYRPYYKCAYPNLPHEERWMYQTFNNHSALQHSFRKSLLITDQNIFGIRYSNCHGLQLLMSYMKL